MSAIDKRPNGKWRARWYDESGQRQSKSGFARKIDAQRHLDEVTASKVTGQYVTPQAGRITFRDYAEEYRVLRQHRDSTREVVESLLRLHVYPAIGDYPLSAITPTMIQRIVSTYPGGAARVHVMHSVMSGIFKAAVRDRRIPANPCVGTDLPEIVKKRVLPFTTEQVEALAAEVPPKQRALVLVTAGTGLRQGEVWGLSRDRIDFDAGLVRVDRQLVRVAPGNEAVFGPPKTPASDRTVPLAGSIAAVLAEHLEEWPVDPWGLVFTNGHGHPWRRSNWGDMWRRVRVRAGLPEGSTFHGLRHHYASLLIRRGVSVKSVQTLLGHASATETLDTYSHLWPDSDDQARAAIDAAFATHGSPMGPKRLTEVRGGRKAAGQRLVGG